MPFAYNLSVGPPSALGCEARTNQGIRATRTDRHKSSAIGLSAPDAPFNHFQDDDRGCTS